MDLLDIVTKVGGAVVKSVVPGGGAIVDIVNEFLPADKKLTNDATGSDIRSAVDSLPADKRADLLAREFDVDITQIQETNSTLRTMLESDARSPHSTRPKIALGSFYLVAFVSVLVVLIWSYAVVTGNVDMVKTVTDGWAWLSVLIAPFVGFLANYFGVLKSEHRDRLNATIGAPTPPSVLSSIIRKGK